MLGQPLGMMGTQPLTPLPLFFLRTLIKYCQVTDSGGVGGAVSLGF